jgi:hypothetical protein
VCDGGASRIITSDSKTFRLENLKLTVVSRRILENLKLTVVSRRCIAPDGGCIDEYGVDQ